MSFWCPVLNLGPILQCENFRVEEERDEDLCWGKKFYIDKTSEGEPSASSFCGAVRSKEADRV